VVAVDNLSNSSSESTRRVEKITGVKVPFYQLDVCNEKELEPLFINNRFDAVLHFAGLKSVSESTHQPLEYYINNVDSTLVLLGLMKKYEVRKFIFSSSATVYGTPETLPLVESSRTGVEITNPYGWTKFVAERVLQDVSASDNSLEVTLLRYFNPIGAHESGLIGEDPEGVPNNIMPYISQVAVGRRPVVDVFGDNYDTPDGTGVRDYIHVVDLARGHVAALLHSKPGVEIYNLGTGKGVSVLELIAAFSNVAKRDIPYRIVSRRPGDLAACYSSPLNANAKLGWRAELSLEKACEDAWRWQSMNPGGFKP